MTKILYLVRHAEAESSGGGLKDLNRHLTSIGVRDSNHLGMFLANAPVHPDIIMTSHSDRAQETALILAEQMRYGVDKIKIEEELYEAPIRILLRLINELPENIESAVVVAHNPGISFLADYLTGEDIGNMTPCTSIAIEFEVDKWTLVAAKTGHSKFIRLPD